MKLVKLSDSQWQLGVFRIHGVDLTHEPQEVSNTVAEKLLQLRHKGRPLVVVTDEEAAPETTQEVDDGLRIDEGETIEVDAEPSDNEGDEEPVAQDD